MIGIFLALATAPAEARYASIVIDTKTGKVLHATNADTPNYPASLTKMMTLYMIFEAIDGGKFTLQRRLPVSRVAAGRSPSKLGLRRGQRISVADIIGALVTKSANDAATVAAEALGGTERKFARLMTAKARALGMTRTVFLNASGLPHRSQHSTARDMATLAAALRNDFPHFYHYFSLVSYRYKGRNYRNHNKLLKSYEGVDGLKTGYIRASGYNLVASVKRGGRRLVGVVFGGRSARWRDRHMMRLFNSGYAALEDSGALNFAKADAAAAAAKTDDSAPIPKRKPIRILAQSEWSIQVGTFRRYATAHLAITQAARAVPTLLRIPISIQRDNGDLGEVFHARLKGLSEKRAKRSCRSLKRRKISCVAIPTDESTGQGSR
ncbi:MAG: D-alanyl-D-alanine carboxypeptidase [Rhodospirillales bacterium]|nr:D-alanyl-D-alanine carboxypeptidase [Rhodospirillales bacterium]